VHNAERINKLDSLFLTHLDLLDDLEEIKVCTGYKNKSGDSLPRGIMPSTIVEYASWTAQYETLKGWKKDTRDCKRFEDLPTNAQSFVKFIEKKTRKEIVFVSVSSDPDEGLLRTRLN